jgi:hypothetical protein
VAVIADTKHAAFPTSAIRQPITNLEHCAFSLIAINAV